MKSSLPFPDPVSSHLSSQRGSGIFIILIAIVLFAALTYAISRNSSGGKSLDQEKTMMVATEILDTANRLAETVSVLRLHGTKHTELSFEYNGNYINASCATDSCKIFSYDGGGLDWETPPASVTDGEGWGYSGDMAIADIGTSSADLVMFLPNLPVNVCHRINVMLGIDVESGSPPYWMSGITADQFTGTYNAAPTTISEPPIDGEKSGCLRIEFLDGTAVDASPQVDKYVFYQILIAR
ncbi:MAG: hypothetical protein AUJ12_08900 [Alphaproteobacteria bacterium CG1_02_46_17]|nr:MAG: hypothetical protein AUJ12_08900 [Alphaproteobacteria bacterium CG1_02_46_17]